MVLIIDKNMKYLLIFFTLFVSNVGISQNQQVTLRGKVDSSYGPVSFASVYLQDRSLGTTTDVNGRYTLLLPLQTATIIVQSQGYRSQNRQIIFDPTQSSKEVNFTLVEDALGLEQVVVSATRNRIKKKDAPVIVTVLGPKLFSATQSISLVDGLNYQPGVRVEKIAKIVALPK